MQESIELAKKSWELSHLQSLREEEERIAEEDASDDILLTYDRPELANKVILRRHSSTGMWEVCSPNKNSQPNKLTNLVVADSHNREVSTYKEQVREPHHIDSQSKRRYSSQMADGVKSESDCGMLSIVSSNKQKVKRRSPRSLHLGNQDVDHLKEQQNPKAAWRKKNMDPDYMPLPRRTSSGGSSAVKTSPCSKRRSIDRDLKSPRLCLSPTLPYTCKLPKSQSSGDTVGTNHIEISNSKFQNDDCIGSRTRQRITAQVQSKNQIVTTSGSTISSPSHSSESSPTVSHKYPTRHKMTGQS